LEAVVIDDFMMYTDIAELVEWAGSRQQLHRLVLPTWSAEFGAAEQEQIAKMLGWHPGLTIELPEGVAQLKDSMRLLAPDLADWFEEILIQYIEQL
jgi:hypothetical protein